MATCPTCERPPVIRDPSALASKMAGGLDCYQGTDRHYYLTRGGGEVLREAIDAALRHGLIKPKWDDAPHLEYWRLVASRIG